MLKNYAHLLATIAILSTLILSVFVAQQRSQIKRLTEEIDALSPRNTPAAPEESTDVLVYQRETDARILKLEGELGVLRRARQNNELGSAWPGDGGEEADLDDPVNTLSPVEQSAIREALQDPDDPLRKQLRDVFREENSRMRDERQQQRLSRMLSEVEESFETFATTHSLTMAQRNAVLPRLKAERTQLFELMRARRDGDMDREEIREQLDTIRVETDAFVSGELDAEQLDAYTTARAQEQERFDRRGGRRERTP